MMIARVVYNDDVGTHISIDRVISISMDSYTYYIVRRNNQVFTDDLLHQVYTFPISKIKHIKVVPKEFGE